MSTYHPIEQEIIEKTHFIPEKTYRKRQQWLEALLRAASDNITDNEWESLSEEAKDWTEIAADAFRAKQPLPDFDGNGVDHDATSNDYQGGEMSDIREPSDSEDGKVLEGQTEGTEDEGGLGKIEPAKKKAPAKRTSAPKAKVRAKKEKGPSRGTNEWGVINGTKSAFVCQMLARPEGTTMREIAEATGQAHYNLCGRLVRYGHTIKKEGTRLWLLHKDSPQ